MEKQAQASAPRFAPIVPRAIAAFTTRGARAALAALATAAVFACSAVSASAFEVHQPLPFSPITKSATGAAIEFASALSVDETNGNVFLYQPLGKSVSRVDILGADGGAPVGLAAPYQIASLNNENRVSFGALALDNSATSPNRGTLYVNEFPAKAKKFIRNGAAEKYEAAGELKAKMPPISSPRSFATDSAGNVFLAEAFSTNVSIVKFSPSGTQLARIKLDDLTIGAPQANDYAPISIAVDNAGDLFVAATLEGNPLSPATKVVKYSPNGAGELDEHVFTEVFNGDVSTSGENVSAIAVDPTTNSLYLGLRDHVVQRDATTLAFEGEFGSGLLSGISAIAVNSSTGRIYVSENGFNQELHVEEHNVAVFGPGVRLPSVTANPPTKVIGTKATLNATVNPEGIAVTDCKFEYGTTASYGTSIPCQGSIPTDGSDHPVTANLTGLTPDGVTYHFRISASSANGTSVSPDQTLVTGPPSVTEAATNVSGAKATLNGTVLPQNLAVTECKFEYGTTNGYGASVPCLESVPTDDGEHAVTASLENLLANGAVYHFRIVTDGAGGPVQGNDETLVTANTFVTEAAAPIAGTTATLNGTVKLEGLALTDCKFEYGPASFSGYGSSVPCAPLFSTIPNDSADHHVTGALVGLTPNTDYHFRLVAENGAGTILGADQAFETHGRPLISGQSATSLSASKSILEGQINPSGSPTSYYFEWGTDASYGNRVPSESELSAGSGESFVNASAELSGLKEGTTYHFHLVATNGFGTSKGPDQTFNTPSADAACPNSAIRATQGAGTLLLPDCMALEMVSPSQKGQQYARAPSVSVDGSRVLFNSIAALANTPSRFNVFGDDYVATRGPSGWVTAPTTPLPPLTANRQSGEAQSFTPDFSSWFQFGNSEDEESEGRTQAFQHDLNGDFSPISPRLAPLTGRRGVNLLVGSADHSHLYFAPSGEGEGEPGARTTTFLPGDPQPNGTGADVNAYVSSVDSGGQTSLALLARDRDGKVWGANCGARLGGSQSNNGSDLYLPNGRRTQGAVSPDGSQVYFSTRPDQPEAGNCLTASKMRIMVRKETPAGPEITELFQSECDRVSPACSANNGDDVYQGASVDQTRVYFTSNRQLASTDRDGSATSCSNTTAVPGCDLYLYDSTKPAGERLTQVSAGDASDPTPGEGADVTNSITAISADGSHVYFVARNVLTSSPNPSGAMAQNDANNLYAYEYPEKKLSFVGTLDSADQGKLFGGGSNWSNGAYSVPILGVNAEGEQIGGDGHVLLFQSAAQLTTEDSDASRDIFRYDTSSESLQRISKAGPGGADNGPFEVRTAQPLESTTAMAAEGRWVSENGETVVFSTAEALLPGDDNGLEDSYMWRNGQLFRLPGSGFSGLPKELAPNPTLSADGSTVAFTSAQQLLPSDGDSVQDVYVARAGGGYPPPPLAPDCAGEVCQGEPTAASGSAAAPSSVFSEAGGPKGNPPRKCGKGKVRKHGKCVKKPAKKKHHHGKKPAKKRHSKRSPGHAAAHSGGGSK